MVPRRARMRYLLILPLVAAGLCLFLVGPVFGILYRIGTGDARPWPWVYDIFRDLSFMASIMAASLLDNTLTKPGGYPFGSQTISAVLGANMLGGTLSPLGKKLQELLDYIDPDHCLKAYNNIQTP